MIRIGRRYGSFAALACAALSCFGLSCIVEGDDGTAVVRVSLDLGEIDLAADALPGPRAGDGFVHLDEVPAYVHVVVTGPGIDTPLVASWPSEDARTPREVVEFDVEVPAGTDRHFSILACVRRSGEIRAWEDDGTIVRDLPGGIASDLAVTIPALGSGTIAGTLDGARSSDVIGVIAVDGDPAAGSDQGPGIAFPEAVPAGSAFTIPDVPVGRPITFVLSLAGGETVRSTSPPVSIDTDGQTLDWSVVVP